MSDRERVVLHMVHLCGNELASLLPKFNHVWEAIAVDIFFSPHVEITFAGLLGRCRAEGEFTCLTVDSTVKPTLPLLGQVCHNRKRSKKLSQAVPYNDQLHAVRNVRGSRGSVLLVEPMFSENIEASAVLYMGKFTPEMRGSTLYFCADKTNVFLEAMMRQVFCNLRGCALGPLHLAFAIEAASWGKRTEISCGVRKILSKFSPYIFGSAAWGKFYRGDPIKGDKKNGRAEFLERRRVGNPH